jgi:hypothetical protein
MEIGKKDILEFIQAQVAKDKYFVLDVNGFSICVLGFEKEKSSKIVFANKIPNIFSHSKINDIIMIKNYEDKKVQN